MIFIAENLLCDVLKQMLYKYCVDRFTPSPFIPAPLDMLKGADIVMTLRQMHTIIKCITSEMDIIYRVDIDLM